MTVTPPPPEHRRHSPRLPVVLYAHPFELALGAALIVNGVRGFVGSLSPSVDQLPQLPLALYLVVSTVGGLGVVIGLVVERKAIERSALYLVAASYAAYGILLVSTNGAAAIASATVAGVVAAACVLRAKAIRKAAQIVLATLITSREEAE
jgi:hypothetical protein